MMPRLNIRIAERINLKAILKLQKLCYLSEAALYNDYTIEPLTQSIGDLTNGFDSGTIFLAGYLNEKLIASVRGNVKNDIGFINKLIVHPDFQNRGYGKMMMKAIEAELKTTNTLELFTGNKSVKNIKLYENLGYKIYKHEMVNQS